MKQSKETLKEYFETGDKPTQEQYSDLIDSYIDNKQEAGDANRRFVIDETGDVNITSELKIPEYTLSEIENNKLSLLKDGEVVKEINLTSYIDDTNLARLISGTVDENGLATLTREDNSSFTIDFSILLSEALPPSNFYETGTWPINMLVQGTHITPKNSYTYFVRQGNQVNCIVDLRIFDTSSQTNDSGGIFQFDLPFPCLNNSAVGSVIEFNSGDGTNAVQYNNSLTPDVVNNKLFIVKSLKREYLRPGNAVFHDDSGSNSTRIIISFSYLTSIFSIEKPEA